VEMVSIVLAMLALRWLPLQGRAEAPSLRRWLHGAVALACGGGMAFLLWQVLEGPGSSFNSIAPYFLENSLTQGGGANVVNVILVDFRGFDTWGEITVLAIAAITIHALLVGFVPPPAAANAGGPLAQNHPLMLQTAARLVLPFAALIAIHLFLRGHNLPGGGFIAGLVLSIGLVLLFVAFGRRWAGARVGEDFRGVIGWGLLVAGGTGIGSFFFGAPFLTSTYDYPLAPLVGSVPLASASLFDLGVFMVVVGATMVSLTRIARLGQA
jgi:multicomponent K+:H+ antiporter subunit A